LLFCSFYPSSYLQTNPTSLDIPHFGTLYTPLSLGPAAYLRNIAII